MSSNPPIAGAAGLSARGVEFPQPSVQQPFGWWLTFNDTDATASPSNRPSPKSTSSARGGFPRPGVPLAFDADAHGAVDAQDVEDTQHVRRWATKDDAPGHPLCERNDGL